jgi:hypothetical protein
MKRITRDRRLSPEEAAKYRGIREQVAEELPDLFARHQERAAALDELEELFHQLKNAREERGLSLSELTELTGMDRSALFRSSRPGGVPIPRSRPWCATPRPSASGSSGFIRSGPVESTHRDVSRVGVALQLYHCGVGRGNTSR